MVLDPINISARDIYMAHYRNTGGKPPQGTLADAGASAIPPPRPRGGVESVAGAVGTGATEAAKKARPGFGMSVARGFGKGMGNAYRGTAAGIRGASALTKATLGASIGQMGAAGLLLGGIGVAAASLAFDDPAYQAGRATGAVASFHRGMKASMRPTYGSSSFNQSTQGLVFGLHNGRTAY